MRKTVIKKLLIYFLCMVYVMVSLCSQVWATEAAATPESASMFLVGTGLIALATIARKRLKK